MRCVCCRSPVDEEKVCCPRCGFPLLGGDQENRRRIAGDYRKKLLGDTFLSVRQYFYGYDSDGDLQELKSEYVRAACAGELPPEGIRWLNTEFAPLASGRDVELEIQIQNGSRSRSAKLLIAAGKLDRMTQLGIYSDEGLRVRFAVGNGTQAVLSDSVPLLINQN